MSYSGWSLVPEGLPGGWALGIVAPGLTWNQGELASSETSVCWQGGHHVETGLALVHLGEWTFARSTRTPGTGLPWPALWVWSCCVLRCTLQDGGQEQ